MITIIITIITSNHDFCPQPRFLTLCMYIYIERERDREREREREIYIHTCIQVPLARRQEKDPGDILVFLATEEDRSI